MPAYMRTTHFFVSFLLPGLQTSICALGRGGGGGGGGGGLSRAYADAVNRDTLPNFIIGPRKRMSSYALNSTALEPYAPLRLATAADQPETLETK